MSDDRPDLFAALVQPLFEEHRAAFLAEARRVALTLGRDGRAITINDVRAVIRPPDDIDPRVMGAVFRTADWQNIGYGASSRRECHGRPVARFKLLAEANDRCPHHDTGEVIAMSVNQSGEDAVNIVGRSAKRMWCSSCQTEGDVLGFCGCAEPVYVTAGERAAAAVAANPEESDRAIAEEINVSQPTVSKARKSTDKHLSVEDKPQKRIGLDGKARKLPTPNDNRRAATLAQAEKAAALQDAGWDVAQIAAELGHSKRYTGVILEKIGIGRGAAVEAGGDQEALRPTEEQKLARAIRRAEAAIEVRVLEECKRRIETMSLPLYRKEQDEARAIIKNRRGYMSLSAFTKISSLLHPDRVQDEGLKAMHTEAFDLFRRLKIVLVKEAEFPAPQAPDVPRSYDELMEMRRQATMARRKNKGGSDVVMH